MLTIMNQNCSIFILQMSFFSEMIILVFLNIHNAICLIITLFTLIAKNPFVSIDMIPKSCGIQKRHPAQVALVFLDGLRNRIPILFLLFVKDFQMFFVAFQIVFFKVFRLSGLEFGCFAFWAFERYSGMIRFVMLEKFVRSEDSELITKVTGE